jgi:hypothetical protein
LFDAFGGWIGKPVDALNACTVAQVKTCHGIKHLIPLFANLIGVFALDEIVTGPMLLAGLVILLGTAMASGLFPRQPMVSGA